MATVDANVINGSRLRETLQGKEKVLVYRVYDLTGDEGEREVEALAAVPAMGTAWGPDPELRADSRNVQAMGPDHAEVRVTYRTPSFERPPQLGDAAQIEIVSTLETVVTDTDKDDNYITVSYSGDSENPEVPANIKEVSFQKPTFGIRYTRRENISGSALSDVAAQFNGHVNSSSFAGQPARSWLALITGRSNDGGQTYVVTYTFFYEPKTWDSEVKAVNPETGKIPEGVTEGDGITTSQIYPEANFNSLNL